MRLTCAPTSASQPSTSENDAAFSRSFTRALSNSWIRGAVAQMLFALPRLRVADLSAGNRAATPDLSSEASQLGASTGDAGHHLRAVDCPASGIPLSWQENRAGIAGSTPSAG